MSYSALKMLELETNIMFPVLALILLVSLPNASFDLANAAQAEA
jgi:hypothetical protein